MKTPLNHIQGLGSAKSGTKHFWHQRLTAVANVPLFIFFIYLVISSIGADRGEIVVIFANPFVAALTALMIVSATIHMRLGLQVVIEDYVHKEPIKIALFILNSFFSLLMAALALIALVKLVIGG